MNIQHTNAFDANILKKVMHIESKIYPPELRGTWTAACARFKNFPNYLITVHNNNDVVGYLCYIPVSDALYFCCTKGGLELAKKFGFTIINFTPEGYCSVQRRG